MLLCWVVRRALIQVKAFIRIHTEFYQYCLQHLWHVSQWFLLHGTMFRKTANTIAPIIRGLNKQKYLSVKLQIHVCSVLTFVLGAQKNRLNETVLLSTHNIHFGWEVRKFILWYILLTKGLYYRWTVLWNTIDSDHPVLLQLAYFCLYIQKLKNSWKLYEILGQTATRKCLAKKFIGKLQYFWHYFCNSCFGMCPVT